MKHEVCLGYQIATPEVMYSPDLTCLYGDPEKNLKFLHDIGYNAAEFMTVDPKQLVPERYREYMEKYNIRAVLACTGEVFGTLGLSFLDPMPDKRLRAVERVREIIDFAHAIGANINIGRVRGNLCAEKNMDASYAIAALKEICDYAKPLGVDVLVEPIEKAEENYINTVSEAAELKMAVKRDNLSVMMDYCAMSIEEVSIPETVRQFGKRTVKHVHLSEVDRWYPGHENIGKFEEFIRELAKADYIGPFVIEVLSLPDARTAAEKSFEVIAPLLSRYYGY